MLLLVKISNLKLAGDEQGFFPSQNRSDEILLRLDLYYSA